MAKKRTQGKTSAIDLLFAVTCDAVFIDPNTNKATLYGVFDKITLPPLPSQVTFTFFAKLRIGIGQHVVSLHLIAPNAKETNLGLVPIDAVEEGSVPLHAVVTLGPDELKETGEYQLQIRSERKDIGDPCRILVGR